MLLQTTRDDHRIAWLAALAITIHMLESGLPSPLPGAKPGLANVITIAVLVCFGWRAAVWVSLLRVLAGSLLLDPFPLAGATTFRIACRVIRDRRYAGDADFGTELATARWRQYAVRVTSG